MKSLNKKSLLTYIFLVFGQLIVAQQYKFRSSIDTVHQTGFYKIIISPEISAHCKIGFSDIRIIDSTRQEIPFIVRNSFPRFDSVHYMFIEFPIIKNELTDSGKSILIIKNQLAGSLYELSLLIKNASVNRLVSLSGSNDKKKWFIIDDKIVIQESHEFTKDSYLQSLQFPVATYKYLKLVINNAGTDPLDIQKAGFYVPGIHEPGINPYTQNPIPSFTQKDSSDKKTYIKVINTNNVQFDNVEIKIEGSAFYSRKAELYLPFSNSITDKISSVPVASFLLQSNTGARFDITKQKTQLFYIVINNNDNPPLKISGIVTRQLQNEIVAYLEKGKQYSLLTDNPAASQPDYDLEKFRDSISTTIDPIKTGVLLENNKPTTIAAETKTTSKTWLWIIISLAGLLLTFFTFRLSKDINKSGM
jgi:hypothetical protein